MEQKILNDADSTLFNKWANVFSSFHCFQYPNYQD